VTSKHFASRAFLVLAAWFALVGAASFSRSTIGTGLTGADYFNLLFLLTIPKLIPFAAAILAACFSLVYYAVESKGRRAPSSILTVIHLVTFVLTVVSHAVLVNFWWTALNGNDPTHARVPMSGALFPISLIICFVTFGANLYTSLSKTLVTGRSELGHGLESNEY
jgi:hypothetical protein